MVIVILHGTFEFVIVTDHSSVK